MGEEERWLALLEQGDVEGFNAQRTERTRVELFAADLSGRKLGGVDLSNANLEKSDLTEADLTDANLMKANLAGIDGSGLVLKEALGLRVRFKDAWLDGADLTAADLAQADFADANLERSTGAGVRLAQARLRGVKAKGSVWPGADLSEAKLGNADFREADLRNAELGGAILEEADFSGARLEGISAAGVKARGAKLVGARLAGAKLQGANLSGADLTGADLAAADLTRANLTGAKLTNAVLRGAVLADATLDEADLTGADLADADLSGIDPTALGLDAGVTSSLSGFGVAFDESAELVPSDVSVARAGAVLAFTWENPEGEPELPPADETTDPDAPAATPVQPTVLRFAVWAGSGWKVGVVPIPGEAILDHQVVATGEGFKVVVTRTRADGATLVVFPLDVDGALGTARSAPLGYDPLVPPVLRLEPARTGPPRLRMYGLARRGPTLVVHDLTEVDPKLVRSDAVSTAVGFLPGHPVLACKGGVVMAVGPNGPQPPRRSPDGFPGHLAAALQLGDEILAWWAVKRLGQTPGGMRASRIGRRHAPKEELLGRNAVVTAVGALDADASGIARVVWVDRGRDGAQATQLWQASFGADASDEPAPMPGPEDIAELRVAPGVIAVLGEGGTLVMIDPETGRTLASM
ncbi:MAG: pentapeptide repeat-containing protein [Myxococcota bacterium]